MYLAPKPPTLFMVPTPGELRNMLLACSSPQFVETGTSSDGFDWSSIEVLVVPTARLEPGLRKRLPALRLVACLGGGYDPEAVRALRASGVDVTHSPGTNHLDVADATMGMMIAVVRRLAEGDRLIRAGAWNRPVPLPMSPSLRDLRYGIFGLGAIGAAVAQRLEAFADQIAWWGPNPKPAARWRRAASLIDLARDCNVLFVTAKLTPETTGAIDSDVLDALGEGYLINVARGGIVNEEALRNALNSGRLAGAASDVFAREPLDLGEWESVPNAVLTPHLAGWGQGTLRDAFALVAANISAYANGSPLVSRVPDV